MFYHSSTPPLASAFFFFFFNDTATPEIYTFSLHDALPILPGRRGPRATRAGRDAAPDGGGGAGGREPRPGHPRRARRVLSRRDRHAHRRVPPPRGRSPDPRRSRGLRRGGGAGAPHDARSLRGRRLRLLVPGSRAAPDAQHARGRGPQGARPQLGPLPAPPRGDDQDRVRRSGRLLR